MSEEHEFKTIGAEDFKELPAAVRMAMVTHWAESNNRSQTVAASRMCPASKIGYAGATAWEDLFMALMLVDEAKEIKDAAARARREIDGRPEGVRQLPMDFGRLAAQAILADRLETAEALIDASDRVVSVFDDKRGRYSALSAAAIKGNWALAQKTLEKSPQALSVIFDDTGSDVKLGKSLISGQTAQESLTAWSAALGLLNIAKKMAIETEGMILEPIKHALFFSKEPLIREQSAEFFGEKARQKLIEDRVVNHDYRARDLLEKTMEIRDEKMLTMVARSMNLKKVDDYMGARGPSGGSILGSAIKAGNTGALGVLLSEAAKSSPSAPLELLTRGFWVWNSETNPAKRKKGDALALCVAEGQLECAQLILERYPDLDRSYAKAAVKYLASASPDGGEATATWESLILSEAAPAAPPQAAPTPARRRL